ncbi:MAG: autoinducer binding domain-containing protein, partial [Pseudomonadota bacterium]
MSAKTSLEDTLSEIGELSPGGYFLGLHIRFTSPLMTLQTYPAGWIERYTERGYALRDPIVAWGFSQNATTRWSEIEIPDPFGILEEAASFGLKYGAVVPVGELRSRTIGSVARSDREFSDAEIALISHHIRELHRLTEPPERLTEAQLMALSLIAEGERHTAAAAKLNISESALKARLTAARTKLLARTTAEAIQRAKDYGLL